MDSDRHPNSPDTPKTIIFRDPNYHTPAAQYFVLVQLNQTQTRARRMCEGTAAVDCKFLRLWV